MSLSKAFTDFYEKHTSDFFKMRKNLLTDQATENLIEDLLNELCQEEFRWKDIYDIKEIIEEHESDDYGDFYEKLRDEFGGYTNDHIHSMIEENESLNKLEVFHHPDLCERLLKDFDENRWYKLSDEFKTDETSSALEMVRIINKEISTSVVQMYLIEDLKGKLYVVTPLSFEKRYQ